MQGLTKGVGIDIPNIDKSVSPCEDFFLYANGNWIKNNPVPATESHWSSFHEVANETTPFCASCLPMPLALTNAAERQQPAEGWRLLFLRDGFRWN